MYFYLAGGDYNAWGSELAQQQQRSGGNKHYNEYYERRAAPSNTGYDSAAIEQGVHGLSLADKDGSGASNVGTGGGGGTNKDVSSSQPPPALHTSNSSSGGDKMTMTSGGGEGGPIPPSSQTQQQPPSAASVLAGQPKKGMSWASIASQPAKVQPNRRREKTVLGTRHMDIGTWDSKNGSGPKPVAPPPAPRPAWEPPRTTARTGTTYSSNVQPPTSSHTPPPQAQIQPQQPQTSPHHHQTMQQIQHQQQIQQQQQTQQHQQQQMHHQQQQQKGGPSVHIQPQISPAQSSAPPQHSPQQQPQQQQQQPQHQQQQQQHQQPPPPPQAQQQQHSPQQPLAPPPTSVMQQHPPQHSPQGPPPSLHPNPPPTMRSGASPLSPSGGSSAETTTLPLSSGGSGSHGGASVSSHSSYHHHHPQDLPSPGSQQHSAPAASSGDSQSPILEDLQLRNKYNPDDLTLDINNARFFVIKSYSEDDVHRSIKYEIWCSTEHGNKRLDQAFKDQNEKKSPIYLFFSVNGTGHFCGLAHMLSAIDYSSTASVWAQDKWKGQFKVKWIYVKDVPNHQLRHIRLENNDNKPVTKSRDTQEVPFEKGKQVRHTLRGVAIANILICIIAVIYSY